jgi:GNAT superfamily N-acetyltransferase
MTIREMRQEESASVTDLYLEASSLLSERDRDWNVPDSGSINRWVIATREADDAVCLVAEVERAVGGYLLASVARHPALPGVLGKLEEVYVRRGPEENRLRRELVEAGMAWARERGAGPIQATVALEVPWTDEELSFWASIGFEHDQGLVTRY